MNATTGKTLRIPVNGITYQVTIAGNGVPLVLLHGFTGRNEAWSPHVPEFSTRYQVIAVDQLGHGGTDSPADPERYRMEHAVADLLAMLDLLLSKDHPVHLLGYSMGGRLALQLAVAAPERLRCLVLESASAGIQDPGERAIRLEADEALATRIERDGVDAFVEYWEHIPLFATQQRLPEPVRAWQRAQRRTCTASGLANSVRGSGVGAQLPLYEKLSTLPMPVLLIAGGLDSKYRRMAETMARRIPSGRAAIVPDSGHTVHLEQPDLFDRVVLEFLTEADHAHCAETTDVGVHRRLLQ